jgi:peptidoglycan/LPS O-acetylase OafA/YrhL
MRNMSEHAPATGDHRDNNFDALRIFAAALVILSHSWALTLKVDEPVAEITYGSINGGALGVWMFFVISGYLVSQSFVQRDNLLAFIEARFLRIYPAFAACIVFGVALGAMVSTLPLSEYFAMPLTWKYLGFNLLFELRYQLPGVFITNPYPNAVNGSIWTLPAETMMYVLVALMGLATLLRRHWLGVAMLVGLLALLSFDPALVMRIPYMDTVNYAPAVRCFLLGMLFYLLRDRIPLLGAGVVALFALVILLKQNQPPGTLLVCVLIAYTTLWLALHPRLRLPVSPRIGDVSYGLYVFAFPIQQTLVWLMPNIMPWTLFAMSFVATFAVAWCSWHALEKPALGLKGLFSGWLRSRRRVAA